MSAMRNVPLRHLQVGAAHVANDTLCSLDADVNRPMSRELKHIAARKVAKAAGEAVAVFVRGSAIGAVGVHEVRQDFDLFLDLLLDLVFLGLDVLSFGLDFLVFCSRLALDGNVGGLGLRFLFDWLRGRETWWHLWIAEEILEGLSVDFVGHTIDWEKCKRGYSSMCV